MYMIILRHPREEHPIALGFQNAGELWIENRDGERFHSRLLELSANRERVVEKAKSFGVPYQIVKINYK